MRHRERGFTLLEVLAAIALLGILYTVLAGVAIQGLRSEGLSRRRLEASLLADRHLVELDLEIDAGGVPGEGVVESEEGDFVVTTTVEPYEIPLPPREDGEESEAVISLLGALSPGAEAPVRRIEVKVSWLEPGGERSIRRVTFGFDLSSVADLLEAATPAPEQGGNLSGEPDEGALEEEIQ